MNLARALIFICLFAVAACEAAPVQIASFSTITTEIAREVGGDRVQVAGLVGPGVDPHAFEPTPEDLKVVARADLVLTLGRHLENYVSKLRQSAGTKAVLLEVGNLLPSPKVQDEEAVEGGTGKQEEDPHWWHSIENMKQATRVLGRAMEGLDPKGKAAYEHNADLYIARLDALESWARRGIALLPRDRRKLVTSHDAFHYFAAEYGFAIYPIQGLSTEDEPSSQKVARIIEMIKREHVKAVFFESIENPKVITEITRESGAVPGGKLYADGLGAENGDAATYEGMFKHNVLTLVNALK
ncbi:MAG: zinc ABC transporter substrate-binding protein [Methylacidiphilales bacterium]|nr:zinc ABC transporter substrate-binding protein [Candidatus Methylacidiphilales bacterium]